LKGQLAVTPLFNGTFVQSFDAKGRVSVPARFRDALRAGSANPVAPAEGNATTSLVLRPSDKLQCIEVWTEANHHALIAELEKLDPLSDEYEAMAIVLFSRAYPMETDKEGRVIIPDMLLGDAGIDRADKVAFLGMGTRFELWHPSRVDERVTSAIVANKARRIKEREAAA
jgi:MraZ protein